MGIEKLIDTRSPNRELTVELLYKGNTGNEFRFYNIENPNKMNNVYDFYEKYAKDLVDFLSPNYNIFNQKTDKKMDFSYVWNDVIDAQSCEWHTKDIMRVNEGVIIKIYALFYTLMARGTVLGINEREEMLLELNQFFHNEKADDILVPMVYCGSVKKNNIAEYMARFAIEFLIGHEIGHVFNGHTKLFCDILEELNIEKNENKRKQLYLDLQTLEMDADAFGICRVLDEVVSLLDRGDKIFGFLQNEMGIFDLLCYSIHGLFYILRNEYGHDDMINCEEQMHPPKSAREFMIYGDLSEYMKFLRKMGKTKVVYDFKKIDLGNIERNICWAMRNENGGYVNFIEENRSVIIHHMERICTNWEQISQKIKPDARLPIDGIDYKL